MFDESLGAWIQETLLYIPALLMALSVHEAAHAYVAYKLGDKSQKALGRLTFWPFAHVDLVGFVFMLIFKFGWGKPVMVDSNSLKNRRKDMMYISLAGPMSNLALALLFTLIIKLLDIFGIASLMIYNTFGQIILNMLMYIIGFNVVFCAFNLIPLPPFDGSKVLYYFLPYKGQKFMDKLEEYSIYILVFLMITGAYQIIIMPLYNAIYWIISLILCI